MHELLIGSRVGRPGKGHRCLVSYYKVRTGVEGRMPASWERRYGSEKPVKDYDSSSSAPKIRKVRGRGRGGACCLRARSIMFAIIINVERKKFHYRHYPKKACLTTAAAVALMEVARQRMLWTRRLRGR